MKNFNDYSPAKQHESKTVGYVQTKAIPHSAAQIYLWLCLAVAAQILHGYALTLLTVVLVLLTLGICAKRFFSLLRRTRWILLSIFVIYAYASRGDALWPQLGAFSPVGAGMEEGFVQLQRLLIVLAGLSILLVLLSQAQLMEGFYTLLFPIFLMGLSRERVAVRLALTLHYAESSMQNKVANWHRNIEQMLTPVGLQPGYIEFQLHKLSWRDWLLVAVSSAIVTGLWR